MTGLYGAVAANLAPARLYAKRDGDPNGQGIKGLHVTAARGNVAERAPKSVGAGLLDLDPAVTLIACGDALFVLRHGSGRSIHRCVAARQGRGIQLSNRQAASYSKSAMLERANVRRLWG